MKRVLDDSLIYEILSAVEEIPEGRTATYGQIACLIGREKNARLVGKVLSRAEYYGSFPCHRVVNHAGRLAPGMAGAGGSAPAGRGAHERRHPCGFKKVQVGSLKTESASAGGGFSLYCLERTVGHDPVTAEICG